MQALRTILWVVVTTIVVTFVLMNWGDSLCTTIECDPWPKVYLWNLTEPPLVIRWPVSFIALVFFALGFLPPWLLGRAAKWRMGRRIENLENSVRAASVTAPVVAAPQPEPAAVPAPTAPEAPAT